MRYLVALAAALSFSSALVFVRAGAVQPGHRNIEQAEVHPELRAMVNEVIHHHAANAGHARHGEYLLAAGQQLPAFHQLRVARRRQCRPRLRGFLVEHRKQILAILDFRRLVRGTIHRSIVQLLGFDGHGGPSGQRGDVSGEPADRSGLLVRLPTPLVIGYAFEDLTSALHFLIEFTQHRLTDCHSCLSEGRLVLRTLQPGNLRRTKGECQAHSWDIQSGCPLLPFAS